MSKQHRNFWLASVMVFMGGIIFLLGSCTHDDQIVDEYIPTPTGPTVNDTKLISQKTTTPPTLDGVIDASWDDATKLVTTTTVPDPGQDVFKGYVGNSYVVTSCSMYDDQNIYFLAEWLDKDKSQERQSWYFDTETKRWKQEDRNPTFDANGVMIRPPFYEDKFAMLWNVNNSVANWDQSTCYTSCHTGLSEADGKVRHYTNAPNERIDMWHWKSVRMDHHGQFDDQHQDDQYPNGRHGDPKDGGGYTNNKQELTITGTTEVVTVPKYFIPNRENYYWITQDEIDAGTAKLITAVDENGVLTYDGGTIDPNTDVEFQRRGMTVGSKAMPSIYTAPFQGNRGDILCASQYTGSGWIVEFSRKLDSGDTENVDVNFSSLEDQWFGIGVFDNAGIAHSIRPNLELEFEK
ncbi:MAG: ethylbenzene dehydrogenase-related protein [Saprospiraceae bacterium]